MGCNHDDIENRSEQTTHECGMQIPTSEEHAHVIDKENGDDFWMNAIEKEIHDMRIAFEIIEHDTGLPMEWKSMTGHLAFDIKMDFTRKARWALHGHATEDPIGSTCESQ